MSEQGFRTTLAKAARPIVLSLDVGSTASRGGLYDAEGRPVDDARHKVHHAFTTDVDGTSTIDPDQVVTEISEILTRVTKDLDEGEVAGIGLDTFASSLVGVDADGRAITPCWTYADSRCGAQVDELRARLDESELQQRTGTRVHSSYLTPRLRWVRATDPELFGRVDRWMSLAEYIHLRLLGVAVAGTPIAAWTGMLNRRTGEWDTQLLRLCGVRRAQLSPVQDPSVPLEPTDEAQRSIRKTWPALREARWFPAIADGLGANIGTGGTDRTTAIVSASTSGAMRVLIDTIPASLPPGLWAYRIDSGHTLLGGALNDVGRALTWLRATVRLPDDDAELDAALRAEPVDTTPLVLPFFTGERSTGWAARARAVVLDLSATHTPLDVARGVLEGVALSYARVARQLREVAGAPAEIRISGSTLAVVPALAQLLADALGAPVTPVTIKRSTLRGTAMLALDVVAPDVERAEPTSGERCLPDAARSRHYAGRLQRFEQAYAALATS